ncbi:hypothetical protein P4S72_22080 [Vibrio sp. PP-XX7]
MVGHAGTDPKVSDIEQVDIPYVNGLGEKRTVSAVRLGKPLVLLLNKGMWLGILASESRNALSETTRFWG